MTASARRVLQLGAGNRRFEGLPTDQIVRLDLRPSVQPDVIWNLDSFPWPFPDASFDVVDCTDVLEHLGDLVRVMEEIHRVGRPACRVLIATPHFSCANSFTDPTHRHHLGLRSFDYFTAENEFGFYTRARFSKVRCELIFHPGPLGSVMYRVARRWPSLYEHHLCWVSPAWFMSVELEVLK